MFSQHKNTENPVHPVQHHEFVAHGRYRPVTGRPSATRDGGMAGPQQGTSARRDRVDWVHAYPDPACPKLLNSLCGNDFNYLPQGDGSGRPVRWVDVRRRSCVAPRFFTNFLEANDETHQS
jgi:hypothetical protein